MDRPRSKKTNSALKIAAIRGEVDDLPARCISLLQQVEDLEQLQNTPQLIYMSLNKNSVYCVMPRSSKLPTHVNELRGILKFSRRSH